MVPHGYIIRPVAAGDLEGLFALCLRAGPGFTSLQADKPYLRALIAASEASFASPAPGGRGTYFLVMESCMTGEIVGCTSVKTGVGSDAFLCADFQMLGASGRSLNPGEAVSDLVLRRTLQGYSEVGSLYLHPAHRASGAGRFLARARYMLMATRPDIFDQPIVSQLRGWSDVHERSPFYDSIWLQRLGQTYGQTDSRLAREGAEFILSDFEGLEVAINRLDEDAVRAIGRPHDTAAGAFRLLQQEGFRPSSLIDMSDGGPLVEAALGDLASIRTAHSVIMVDGVPQPSAPMSLLSSASLENYWAYVGSVSNDARNCASVQKRDLMLLSARGAGPALFSSNIPSSASLPPYHIGA